MTPIHPVAQIIAPSTDTVSESVEPIICDLSAIPADQREAHFALARALLFSDERAVSEVPDGYQFELPPDRLRDAAAFIENERRCCRHLAFSLDIPPRGAPARLRITGPGAREELRALVR